MLIKRTVRKKNLKIIKITQKPSKQMGYELKRQSATVEISMGSEHRKR